MLPPRVPAETVDAPTADPAAEFERAVLDHLYEGVYYVDRARRIRYWNAGAEGLTGYSAPAVVGQFCYQNLLNHVDATGKQLCRSGCPLSATMRDGVPREADVCLRHREGHRVAVRVRTTPVRDREGSVIGAVEIFNESTELSAVRREISELRDLAMHDALTGVPNRRHFEMSMASRIAELAGYGRRFGLLITDIDRFKLVNDAHGHATGDVALRTVARILLEASRATDGIARFGGEEFALTITDVDDVRLPGDRGTVPGPGRAIASDHRPARPAGDDLARGCDRGGRRHRRGAPRARERGAPPSQGGRTQPRRPHGRPGVLRVVAVVAPRPQPGS
jgi:PAS domain S-box-containing protein